jgi:nucleotide-binding universal stress UspA family protein
MCIAKILVPLTGDEQDAAVLAAALATARPFAAHVHALPVVSDPSQSLPTFAAPLPGDAAHRILHAAEEMNAVVKKAAKAMLRKAAAAADVPVLDRPTKRETVACSFSSVEGHFTDCVTRASLLSDLIVFGVPAAARFDVRDCFLDLLVNTRKPVLISPAAAPKPIRKIAIGWDRSAPAADAVVAAGPFLARAERVTILTGRRAEGRAEHAGSYQAGLEELDGYLSLHGVHARKEDFDFDAHRPGACLLDAAMSFGADLLVIGGYGHRSLRESLFGGVTADICSQADLPVLMAH